MDKIIDLLNKEKELNHRLNLEPFDDKNLDKEFKFLFDNPQYEKSHKWLDKDGIISLHDGNIVNLSQKKDVNQFKTSFLIDSISIYENNSQIGYLKNSEFNLTTKESLRDINNKTILNFLIDEESKEIGFLFIEGNQRKIIVIKYNDINFTKGEEVLYQQNNKFKNS